MNIYSRVTKETLNPISLDWLETGNYSSTFVQEKTYFGIFKVSAGYNRTLNSDKLVENKQAGFLKKNG